MVIAVSADAEWAALRELYPDMDYSVSPYGEWFPLAIEAGRRTVSTAFFQGGWGKISAAASTQYAIDRWQPALIVNLGACGGLKGHIEQGTLVIANQTVVYDIVEQMFDPAEAIDFYRTELDLSWLAQPLEEQEYRGVLVSADRDVIIADIPSLRADYSAVVADWESGAIAWVSDRNGVDCVIVRGVTDLVGPDGGEAYERPRRRLCGGFQAGDETPDRPPARLAASVVQQT